jgi:rare lipoprotein A (peptidoglycan hydrolase)
VAVAMSAAMLVVPLLGLARSPHHGRADAQSVAAVDTRAELSARLAGDIGRVSRDQTVLVAPLPDTTTATASPATTVARASAPKPATLRRTTTVRQTAPATTKPAPRPAPAPTAPPPPPKPAHDMSGGASWYSAPTGTCAMRDAPKGTVVRVTNLANGKSVTCTVSDYGPTMQSRIIDLSKGSFSQIADPAQGVIQVRVTW